MEYDWHVRFTAYLHRINTGLVRGYTATEEQAAIALWDAQQIELDLRQAELDLEQERQEAELKRMADLAWEMDLSLHPELQKRKRKKAASV